MGLLFQSRGARLKLSSPQGQAPSTASLKEAGFDFFLRELVFSLEYLPILDCKVHETML